jgi:SulP family sulfate permease
MSGLRRYLPALAWLPAYQRAWRRRDLLAGITITALLVPEGMAYAELAGVSPEAAFYAAPPALLMYALFGSSRRLVVVVSSTQAVFSAATVSALAPEGTLQFVTLTSALALTAGVLAIVAGVLRLGRIAQFFSASVLTGFVSGLALVILIGQVPKVLGIEGVSGDFFEQLAGIVRELPDLDVPTTVVGVIAILGMVALERIDERIPAPLVALVGGILASVALGLDEHGVEVVGQLPAGLAGPRLPDVQLGDIALLLSGAAGLTLLNFAEAYGPARELGREHGEEVDPNQELIGLGAANAGAGLFQGFPIGASLSKTAAAAHAGMQTQLAGVIAAILVVAVALFLTPLFEPLPEAILGAIVIVAVSSMFKAAELQRLWRVGRADFGLALIALAGVLVLDVLPGLLIAVVVSLAVVVWRASSAGLSRLALDGDAVVELEEAPGAIPVQGVLVLRLDGPLFFANADTLLANVLGAGSDGGRIHALVLDLEATIELDVPGADTIDTLGRDLGRMGIDLHLARVHPEALAVLERTGATASVTGIHRRTLDAIRVAAANPPAAGRND